MAMASQTSRIRVSLRRPRRSTSSAVETLSMESRLMTHCLGTGSTTGVKATSLGRPRVVVVTALPEHVPVA